MSSKNINDDATLAFLFKRVWDAVYPVGSIYMSANSTSPERLFGGRWEQIKGRFLLGADEAHQAGAVGGEAEHKLTVGELPNVHGEARMGWQDSSAAGIMVTGTSGAFGSKPGTAYFNIGARSGTYGTDLVLDFGNGQSHNNMPPFLAVYVWKRTA